MNDHTVTENIVQAGFQRSATISCSCGLLIEVADLRKTSLSVVRKRLKEMHENKQKPKSGSKIVLHKEKKSELKELREEVQKEIKTKSKVKITKLKSDKESDEDFTVTTEYEREDTND